MVVVVDSEFGVLLWFKALVLDLDQAEQYNQCFMGKKSHFRSQKQDSFSMSDAPLCNCKRMSPSPPTVL